MPASLGAHCEIAIGFDLEGRLAASTSSKVARHQMKRERVLRNILIALILSIRCSLSKMVYRTHRQRKLWPKIVLAIDNACPEAILHHISRADSRSCRSMWRVAGVHCGEGGVTAYFSVVSSCQPRSKNIGTTYQKVIEPLSSEEKSGIAHNALQTAPPPLSVTNTTVSIVQHSSPEKST